MADAKKCDRCGKLFEPYNIHAGYKVPTRYTNILLKDMSLAKETYKESGDYDLCKECNDSFLEWLSKPNVAKHEYSQLGNFDVQNSEYKLHKKCNEETKENKQKGCNIFGAFDGSIDCLMCQQCDECRELANSIKEASSNGE